jgi:hypothetical protein
LTGPMDTVRTVSVDDVLSGRDQGVCAVPNDDARASAHAHGGTENRVPGDVSNLRRHAADDTLPAARLYLSTSSMCFRRFWSNRALPPMLFS